MADNPTPKSLTNSRREISSFKSKEISELKQDPAKILLLVEDGLLADPEYPAAFFCKLFNMSRRGWDGLAEKGHIHRSRPGKSRLLQAIKEYRDYQGKAGVRKLGSYSDSKNREEARLTRARRVKAEIAIQKEAGELIPKEEFYSSLASVFKKVVQSVSSMQDVLERECGTDPVVTARVEQICDETRSALYMEIDKAYSETSEQGSNSDEEDFDLDLMLSEEEDAEEDFDIAELFE